MEQGRALFALQKTFRCSVCKQKINRLLVWMYWKQFDTFSAWGQLEYTLQPPPQFFFLNDDLWVFFIHHLNTQLDQELKWTIPPIFQFRMTWQGSQNPFENILMLFFSWHSQLIVMGRLFTSPIIIARQTDHMYLNSNIKRQHCLEYFPSMDKLAFTNIYMHCWAMTETLEVVWSVMPSPSWPYPIWQPGLGRHMSQMGPVNSSCLQAPRQKIPVGR